MSTAGYFACFAIYAFIYTRFARAAYRQKLSEDAMGDVSSGPFEEVQRSARVTEFVFDYRASLDRYSPKLKRRLIIARGLALLFLPFAVTLLLVL
jgi:hypothetical protein